MKIATYNLQAGGTAPQLAHWSHLFELVNPDIFLVQETGAPEQYMTAQFWQMYGSQVQWQSVENHAWGSAIFVRSGQITPLRVAGFEGTVVGVEVEGFAWSANAGRKLQIFSIHAPAPYKPSMNQILDQIACLSDGSDLIIGGDFNLTIGVRHPSEKHQDQDLWLLERLRKQFGLISCWQAVHPNRNLPQTLRWQRDVTLPYHCDGIFVPAAWYRYLDKCEVLSSPGWEELSDHNPVIATFAAEPAPALPSDALPIANVKFPFTTPGRA